MILLENKKVRFDYEILEEFTAGMILEGWEVKSIRNKHANLRSAWVSIDKDDQLWLRNFKVTFYPYSNEIMEPERPKKLLLNKKEIHKIKNSLRETGLSVVPTKIFTKDSRLKLEIALVRGKKKYEKRQVLKDRAIKREIHQRLKNF